jgi:hypothetical protein
MRNRAVLEIRISHRYRQKQNDEHRTLGAVSVLNRRMVRPADDFDQLDTICLTVRVDAPHATHDDIAQALRDTFSGGGCSHSYDCCGCATWHAGHIRHVKRREWTLIQSGYRNY